MLHLVIMLIHEVFKIKLDTALHCTALHCTDLHCPEMHCSTIHNALLHNTQCNGLFTLQCTTKNVKGTFSMDILQKVQYAMHNEKYTVINAMFKVNVHDNAKTPI